MNICLVTLLGLIFGILGTTFGGIVGAIFNIKSNKFIGIILAVSAVLMIIIVCLDLIPNSIKYSDFFICSIGIFLGMYLMFWCNNLINVKLVDKKSNKESLLKLGIIIGIGLAIHNFPEGLAIGSGFEISHEFGISIAIAICMHDFPEGIAMAVPMKQGGMEKGKVIFYTILSGMTTGIGALIGCCISNISENMIGLSLGFAAGAMLYIAVYELIPKIFLLCNSNNFKEN